MVIIPWSKRKYITWDVISIHISASSCARMTSITLSGAGHFAESHKMCRPSRNAQLHVHNPVVIESDE